MGAYLISCKLPTQRRVSATIHALFAGLLLGCNVAKAATITVDTTVDEFGTGSACSLREAVQSANDNADAVGCTHSGTYGTDTINLPSGFYTLSRGNFGSFADIDEDNNSVIDIDIRSNLTLQGNAANPPSIGNTSGNYRGRIVQVISGTVTLNSVVLRDGENPNGRFGGGLRSNPGTTVTLNDVRVVGNIADGGAGGILNEGSMTLNDCLVDSNSTTNAFNGGGGIYNAINASLTLNDSRVLTNRTEGNGANGSGAGIYNDTGATLNLVNTTVHGNVIDIGGVVGNDVVGNGGGIFSSGRFTIRQSTISNNVANGNNAKGGGIQCQTATNGLLERSLIKGNQTLANPDVSIDFTFGGGINSNCVGLVIRDSVVDGNSTDPGDAGGLNLGSATVISTTISNNRAINGRAGGVQLVAGVLTNSTIVGNQADQDGGGVYAFSGDFYNSTVVANTSNADGVGGGAGGGVFVDAGDTVVMNNTVLAGNLENNIGDHDDCDGIISSLGHNLIQNASGCSVSGGGGTDLLGINAQLAALADNGGPPVGASNASVFATMLTRAPLGNSPLVDRGDPTGCRDQNGVPLTTDERGFFRPVDGPDPDSIATCDIGAIEFLSFGDRIFAHGFE